MVRIFAPHVESEQQIVPAPISVATGEQHLAEVAVDGSVSQIATEIRRSAQPMFGLFKISEPVVNPTEAVEEPTEEVSETGDAALTMSGLGVMMSWTADELMAMDMIETDYTNRDGETTTYTGIALTTLMDLAGLQDSATTLVFVADDGYSAEVTIEEITACEGCMVAPDDGSYRMVLPGFPGNVQVKGVIEIQVE